MGKTSRSLKHASKMQRKRSVKQSRRSLYASLAGQSKKAKNQKKQTHGAHIYKHAHIMSDCGNEGCKRCYPRKGYPLRGKTHAKAV